MELVCIVCPRGCRINVENGVVSGNGCKRGEAFALSEMTCPMRTVCSTVATTFEDYPVLPVRTNGEIPKDKIQDLMKEINAVVVDKKSSAATLSFKRLSARTSTSWRARLFIKEKTICSPSGKGLGEKKR